MAFTRQQFQEWGALGGRTRAQRLSKARRKQIAKKAGVAPKKPRGRPRGSINKRSWSKVDPQRAASLYRDGATLEELGKLFGVSRERVRQVLKRNGIARMDGGITMRTLKNLPDRISANKTKRDARDRRILRMYGISLDEYDGLAHVYGPHAANGSPISRYRSQKNNSRQRGIAWDISFRDWWVIWIESGYWEDYGRGQGKYCMARWGDIGGYTKDNVKIILATENSSDRPQKKSVRPTGVSLRARDGKYTASKMIGSKTYWIGAFETPELAHQAYLDFQPKRGARKNKL